MIVETKNLTKRYGNFMALHELNLTIEKGAIHGFIGPNGAGKTTTMRILATLLEPTGGQAWVAGYPVTAQPYEVRRRIGYMPDFFGVYDNMKVWEYLDFFAASYKVPPAKRPGMIDDLLALVDLSAKKDSFVEDLSRGMKQRLCLARTLVHEPDLLILDEPASGLDPRARIELRELLKELRNLGKTILVSSHILSELTEMCTHVAIIERGHLLVSGKVDDILQAMQPAREIYVRLMARAPEAMSMIQALPGVLSVQPMPPGHRPGQPVQGWQQPAQQPPQPQPSQGQPGVPGPLPLPPPPPPPLGYAVAPGDANVQPPAPHPATASAHANGAATLLVRVNGDDALLREMLRRLVQADIPVFGFEEAIGNLEDIFLRTTKGLVQ
jgi:ABC-2 type transport system ATP-binding protein